MRYDHAHKLLIASSVLVILFCIGGIITGWVAQENEELRQNSKIESEIVDVILNEGEAEVIITLKDIKSEIEEIDVKYKYENISLKKRLLQYMIFDKMLSNRKYKEIYRQLMKNLNVKKDDLESIQYKDKKHKIFIKKI